MTATSPTCDLCPLRPAVGSHLCHTHLRVEQDQPCEHGCCHRTVCDFAGCDHGSYTLAEIAGFYAGAR